MFSSKIVVELEVVENNNKWYMRGLDMLGEECWEELVDGEYGGISIEELEEIERGE